MEKLKEMWLMPFRFIVAVMEIFSSNRDYFRRLKERSVVAKVVKFGALITIALWLALALLAENEDKNRLTESLNQFWSGIRGDKTESGPEQPRQR